MELQYIYKYIKDPLIIVMLQLTAVIIWLEIEKATPEAALVDQFPNSLPDVPTILTWTNNTLSKIWANKVSTASARGQFLI
jgi:hypothetical protein